MRTQLASGLAAVVCAAGMSVPATALAEPAATPPSGGAPSSGQLTRQERTFLTDATQDAQFQIAAGQLATNRAASTAVRSFGQRMVTDHRKELQQLQSLDRSFGITPPSGLRPDQQNLIKIWSSLRGGPFDCSYAPTMYVGHELDVSMFGLAANYAGNAKVRQFAAGEFSTLRQHLQSASKNLNNLNCSAPPPTASPS